MLKIWVPWSHLSSPLISKTLWLGGTWKVSSRPTEFSTMGRTKCSRTATKIKRWSLTRSARRTVKCLINPINRNWRSTPPHQCFRKKKKYQTQIFAVCLRVPGTTEANHFSIETLNTRKERSRKWIRKTKELKTNSRLPWKNFRISSFKKLQKTTLTCPT